MKRLILIVCLLLCISNVFAYESVSPWIKYSAYSMSGILILAGANMFANTFDGNGTIDQAYIGVFSVMLGIHFTITVYEW